MYNLHISMDDTKGIFKALSSGTFQSIFDTRTLNFLRRMHQLYGTKFNLFCTCVDGTFKLGKVPEIYRDEFIKNASWLMFGFHCYSEDMCYQQVTKKSFLQQYNYFQKQILRITGQEKQLDVLRIHGFQGNKEICKELRNKGVKILLAADDQRKSYYLDEKLTERLNETGTCYDDNIDIKFVKSCTRLEKLDNISKELNQKLADGNELIPIFTHEWQMDKEEIRNKVEICCKWGENHGLC